MYRRFVETNVHRLPDASTHAGVGWTFHLPWTLHRKKNCKLEYGVLEIDEESVKFYVFAE